MNDKEIDRWPDELERLVREQCTRFDRISVIRETSSTQDAARRMNATSGAIIVAGRQRSGRGRLGREWVDTAGHGIAVTFVIRREPGERLAIVAAVGAAFAAEQLIGRHVGLKWPNDLYAAGRKFGGILIEQTPEVALVGVGMNISQTSWPLSLATKAISLNQLGAAATRLGALQALIPSIDRALELTARELVRAYAPRDMLRGRTVTVQCDKTTTRGRVVEVQPLRGLRLQTSDGEKWLPAATTSVLGIEPHPPEFTPESAPGIASFISRPSQMIDRVE